MICIDDQQSHLQVTNFDNLEQILTAVMQETGMESRVVTDVFVNNEPFSELYPHQAEDIESGDIMRVEVRSMEALEMARCIMRELYKVVRLMGTAGEQVAVFFRNAQDLEALEMYADLMEVNRSFLSMVGVLRTDFSLESLAFEKTLDALSPLFSEMLEIQENEDWILLADILEYEYLPLVEKTKILIGEMRQEIFEPTGGQHV